MPKLLCIALQMAHPSVPPGLTRGLSSWSCRCTFAQGVRLAAVHICSRFWGGLVHRRRNPPLIEGAANLQSTLISFFGLLAVFLICGRVGSAERHRGPVVKSGAAAYPHLCIARRKPPLQRMNQPVWQLSNKGICPSSSPLISSAFGPETLHQPFAHPQRLVNVSSRRYVPCRARKRGRSRQAPTVTPEPLLPAEARAPSRRASESATLPSQLFRDDFADDLPQADVAALQEAWDSIGNDDEGDVFFLDEVSADGDSEDEEWRSLQLVEDEDEANDLDDNAEWDTGATVSEESIFDMDRQSWSVSAIPDSVPRKKGQPASSIQDTSRRKGKDLSTVPAFQSLPPHVVRGLQAAQDEADAMNIKLKGKQKRSPVSKTHKRLRIISGAFAGKVLVSGKGEGTRPMMEMVRAAVFDMLIARTTGTNALAPGSRWLDLFAGTGSVGLEALSRGAHEAHFIELDAWVVKTVLKPNVTACRMDSQAVVHGGRAESFLAHSSRAPQYAPAPFDFISVCPPYLLVSYPELFELLDDSPLIKPTTHIIVEYPKSHQSIMVDNIGPLVRVQDRKYGRTYVALYGPQRTVDDLSLFPT